MNSQEDLRSHQNLTSREQYEIIIFTKEFTKHKIETSYYITLWKNRTTPPKFAFRNIVIEKSYSAIF